MVSIIRSPAISDEKRKLASRRPRPKDEPLAPAAGIPQNPSSTIKATEPVLPKTYSEQEVKTLLEQTRLSVLSQVKDEVGTARDLAQKQGLLEGRSAGNEEAKLSFAAELGRVRSIADQLHMGLESGVDGMEDMAVEIAYEAVCKMLGSTVITREGIQALVAQAATHVVGAEKVVVRLHASDLAILRETGTLESALPSGAGVSWISDKNVALGGCVIETNGGELDARLETQMDRLRTALVTARRNAVSAAFNPASSPDRRKTGRRKSEGEE